MIICSECDKMHNGNVHAMQDFRGNTFAVCCDTCKKKIQKMLDKLFYKYGGRKDKHGITICSCAYSPAIPNTKELALEIM